MQLPISPAVVSYWIIDCHSLKISLVREFVIFLIFQLFCAYYVFKQGILQIQLQNFCIK